MARSFCRAFESKSLIPYVVFITFFFCSTAVWMAIACWAAGKDTKASGQATFSVSGRILNLNGRGLPATVQAFPNLGGASPSVNTNNNGEYKLSGLTAGETYSITVTTPDDSVSAWTPDNPIFVGPLTKDVPGLDFTAKFPAWSVSGVICRGTGNLCNAGTQRLSGVTVTLTLKGNSTPVAPVITTDALGAYSFSNLLSARGDYVVMVTSNQYSFPRPSLEYPDIKGNFVNEDYVAGTAKPIVNTSAASFSDTALAVESIAVGFGSGLTVLTESARSIPLPTTLAGVSVNVQDSAGTTRPAPMFYASPVQINYLIPQGTTTGVAATSIVNGSTLIATGGMTIATIAPGIFSASADGAGLAAATVLRVKAGGAQSYEAIVAFDAAQSKFVPLPIEFGDTTDQLFLLLFGTGVRGRTSLAGVTVSIGGGPAPVAFAGPQGDFVGLDQINVGLDRSLQGRGDVDLFLRVDGVKSNTVRVNFK
jgi:uncharacterized protein (TIGR03437 family)